MGINRTRLKYTGFISRLRCSPLSGKGLTYQPLQGCKRLATGVQTHPPPRLIPEKHCRRTVNQANVSGARQEDLADAKAVQPAVCERLLNAGFFRRQRRPRRRPANAIGFMALVREAQLSCFLNPSKPASGPSLRIAVFLCVLDAWVNTRNK